MQRNTKMSDLILTRTFPALYDQNSKVLILGSFPSKISREMQFYYANRTNRFWSVMEIIYNQQIPDRKQFCIDKHIALWDVIASCSITGSSDSSIENVKINPIDKIVNGSAVKAVFTTGRKAEQLYRKYVNLSVPLIPLPSTSAANAAMRLNDLADAYRIIREYTDEEN